MHRTAAKINTLRKIDSEDSSDDLTFWEEDSEKNILFLDKVEARAVSGDLSDSVDSEIPQLKGATLVKLVERVTFEKYADPDFQSDFILTFRSFTNSKELLALMIKRYAVFFQINLRRYNMPPPKGVSYGILQDFKQNRQKPIRLRF